MPSSGSIGSQNTQPTANRLDPCSRLRSFLAKYLGKAWTHLGANLTNPSPDEKLDEFKRDVLIHFIESGKRQFEDYLLVSKAYLDPYVLLDYMLIVITLCVSQVPPPLSSHGIPAKSPSLRFQFFGRSYVNIKEADTFRNLFASALFQRALEVTGQTDSAEAVSLAFLFSGRRSSSSPARANALPLTAFVLVRSLRLVTSLLLLNLPQTSLASSRSFDASARFSLDKNSAVLSTSLASLLSKLSPLPIEHLPSQIFSSNCSNDVRP
jgi:hypothetical protein